MEEWMRQAAFSSLTGSRRSGCGVRREVGIGVE